MGRINDWEVEGEEEKKNMEENKNPKPSGDLGGDDGSISWIFLII